MADVDYLFKQVLANKVRMMFEPREVFIKNVIFNEPATIVFWDDGTKTVVKCGKNEKFDKEKGLAMAISKKSMGNTGRYYRLLKKWID